MSTRGPIRSISAVTLTVSDMDRSVDFYRSLGFEPSRAGSSPDFTTMKVGDQFLNLMSSPPDDGWGRVIFHVWDVDAMHTRALAGGVHPEAEPRDAEWGERYFHVRDPDGHEISFARPSTREDS